MNQKIGFIGLGKLGLPVATVIKIKGFDVLGYDPMPTAWPTYEPIGNWPEGPEAAPGRAESVADVAAHAEGSIVFVAVQTPHEEFLDGTHTNRDIADFDYTYLIAAVKELAENVTASTTIAIISTVAPGTIRREILPLANKYMDIVYNPFFIAMGTTVRDFLEPEFILLGRSGVADPSVAMQEFYAAIHEDKHVSFKEMSYESAELVKMGYNTFITQKINFANWIMQLSHAIPEADVDDVTGALKDARDRVVSRAYLDGGMGDGGACHPRDNIVMEWLSDELGIMENPAQSANDIRDHQARWLADVMISELKDGMDLIIFGYAYKPNTPLTQGSPALLINIILWDCGYHPTLIDPVVDGKPLPGFEAPVVMLMGCDHEYDQEEIFTLPPGSVVIDPFRNHYLWGPDVKVIRLGEATI